MAHEVPEQRLPVVPAVAVGQDQIQRAAPAIRQALHPRKEIMEEMEAQALQTTARAVAVEQAQQEAMAQPLRAVMAGMARPPLSLAHLLLTLAVVAEELMPPAQQLPRAGQVVAALAQTAVTALLAQPIPAAVVEVVGIMTALNITAAMAAPASSFSSTTSARPRSSPSSHRKSGLHQRVR